MSSFNFRKLSGKDLFFVKKDSKARIFEGNKIVKFKPSSVLLASMATFIAFVGYKYSFFY